jgi:hypothetical protein
MDNKAVVELLLENGAHMKVSIPGSWSQDFVSAIHAPDD